MTIKSSARAKSLTLSFSFETNIIYFDSGKLLEGSWADDKFVMDHNLYFDARTNSSPESLRFGKSTLEEWRKRGHDQHSVISDPHFTEPKQNNFSLRNDSPALKLGFRPIDVSKVGPLPEK